MKNFRFGVTALPSIMWYKPDDLKKFKNEGATFRFGVLINAEYSFSGNFAMGFGIGLGSGGGKISVLDSTHYFVNDDEIVKYPNPLDTISQHFMLNTRAYKSSYYNIPISLKMRTGEIGYMRYFVEPRFNIGIKKKVRADDDVVVWGETTALKNENLDITSDMSPIKTSVTISGGGEYYLSGSTAFVFAIGYEYGLSNVTHKDSDNLLRTKTINNKTETGALEQKFSQNGIIISLGILF